MTKLIEKIITVIFKTPPGGSYFSSYLAKNSVQLFLLQCTSLAVGFLSNYVLIKVAGVNDYGQYVYIFNLIYLLGSFSIIGADTLLIKNIPVYETTRNYKKLKGIIFFGIIAAVAGSLIVAFASEIMTNLKGVIKYSGNFNWLILMIWSLLMLSVLAILEAALRGFRKIILSQVAEKIIKPVTAIILIIGIFYAGKRISIDQLIWINLIAIGIALFITFLLYHRNIGSGLKKMQPEFEVRSWIYSAVSFFLLDIIYILNSRIDIFLLGLLSGHEEVAVYNIVLKISGTLSFGLVIINFVLAPVIAKLFASNEMSQLQHLITRSAQMVFLFSVPLILLIFFFGENILVFFGVNILNGNKALLILCFGQFINILCGSVGTLLVMTGHQRFSFYALAIGTVFHIGLNIILTPKYGVIGTAIATTSSLAVWNLLMYFFVRKKIKIFPTAFQII